MNQSRYCTGERGLLSKLRYLQIFIVGKRVSLVHRRPVTDVGYQKLELVKELMIIR
jgi:hypothetical protein